ncbi:MAG: Protein GrpE [Candidatus Moranbacteria bacterium GW2011_GWE1_35_17]|nr:MAG: Protein GrpE [Candidatus Moranbacteria bacterium GW2011_GWE2_35_164]KKP67976.1 MAG: Protein GrpE [Candidatus Moranbacteria bacterium GW2011_GWE1_35_17]KKP83126.1 MAG: Protein GrpE [Candidatus Moranbacteria bacterium GW2011_GWF1_35_5]KKP83993.1 MAG: Protein GrpE [Candidatus Moranbacteria bacterium GW2011_GWF2_35_54]
MKNKKIEMEIEKGWPIQLTVKAVVVNKDGKVLLLKRAEKEVTNSSKYDLPGGGIEKGETMEKSLKRELVEELGLDNVEIVGVIRVGEYPEGHKKFDSLKALRFIAHYNGGEIKLNPREHSEFEWLNIDEAIKKLNTGDGFEEEKMETLKAAKKYLEMEMALDGWKRSLAEFENYKKMQAESQKDRIRYATENIVMQIIPVIDNFHVSTSHIPEDQKDGGWVTGIMYIQKQLENVLAENGVEEINLKVGDNFDTKYCEAVSDNCCHDEKCQDGKCGEKKKFKNKIKKVILKGYKIGDKVIRAARVIVE